MTVLAASRGSGFAQVALIPPRWGRALASGESTRRCPPQQHLPVGSSAAAPQGSERTKAADEGSSEEEEGEDGLPDIPLLPRLPVRV